MPPHAPSPYTYVPDYTNSQYHQPPRPPIHPQDPPMPPTTLTPLRIPSLAETVANAQGLPYSSSRPSHSSSQTTITSPVQNTHSPQYWDSRHTGRSDDSRSSWPGPPADVNISPQRSTAVTQMPSRSDAFSPHVPHRPWSSSASSATSSSSGASAGHYHTSPFPTLTSPFYPSQSPSSNRTTEAVSPSSSSHPGSSPEYFSRSPYSGTNSVAQHGTSHWPQYSRPGEEAQQRQLPALHPVSTFSLSSPQNASPPPSSSAGAQASQMAYWERTRYEGR
jgi:hypothetical protein